MIRTTRNFIQKTGLVYVAVLLLLVTGCSKEATFAKSINNAQQYSAEEIFRAIYFLDGEVVSRIDNLEDISLESIIKDSRQLAVVREKQAEIISSIEKGNPNFLSNWATQITSGDHIQIDNAIKAGADILQRAAGDVSKSEISKGITKFQLYLTAHNLNPQTPAELRDAIKGYFDTGGQGGTSFALLYFLIAAAVVWIVVAVSVAFWVDSNPAYLEVLGDGLKYDEIVDSIAVNLVGLF